MNSRKILTRTRSSCPMAPPVLLVKFGTVLVITLIGVTMNRVERMVTQLSLLPQQELPKTCVPPCTGASRSCDENKNEFCAGGVCIPYGQCNSSTDCRNPANTVVSATTCIGFMDYFAGSCQQVCKKSGCPNDLQLVPYTTDTDPCSKMSRICPQTVSCVVNDYGVLVALFYDMDGNVVCRPPGTSYDGYYLRK